LITPKFNHTEDIMMTGAEIRQHFLDFFKSKGHEIVPSAPIVVKDDPTLLFTNAGMNQFKDYFLGNKKPSSTRVADTQKCLRVSGKHNDLEEVGVDTYHHTMFEMLGNWSFGDYFKKEAIEWSWELLTSVYKIPQDLLYVTVFEGDEKDGLPRDDEAINYWKQLVPEERILMGNKKDNFWEMGDTGPCGPCTEIHVDCRTEEEKKGVSGRELVNKDHPQVIEIWNNVFIQFNRKKDGSLEQLPARHVDTGMGLERLVRVLQQKQSNYDTDLFSGTINTLEQLTGKKYTGTDSKPDVAFRVIADHIRAIAFTIADGQLPSNTGAGYVIRRILRRAVRYYFSYLDVKQPLLHKLIDGLAKQFETVFPALDKQKEFVSKVVLEEENGFLRTLDAGLKRLQAITNDQKLIEGATAFELYDTFGFPIDLTRLIAAENKVSVDEAGFEKEMQQQKDRSRAASALDTEDWIILKDVHGSFVGYDTLALRTNVTKYRKIKTKTKELFQLVLEETPFYAESGGQVGDKGILQFEGESVDVINTKKENDLIIHFTEKLPAAIGSDVMAVVEALLRRETAIHHSATHLLHAALRRVLGNHVQQKGSLVSPEHLRFDFSHFSKMSAEEIRQVEEIVNEKIRENIPVVIKEMNKDDAMATGAMALFGEKYGDIVRVVIIDPEYSIELCGGTHVIHTGELGFFRIQHESAVGAGVRRVEAVSGKAAITSVNEQMQILEGVKELLKHPKDLTRSVEQLISENAQLRKDLERAEGKELEVLATQLKSQAQEINGVRFVGQQVNVSNADALKKLCFLLKKEITNYLIVLSANVEGKPYVAVMIDDAVAADKKLEAPKIIKDLIAPLIRGGGGGQKTLATAGGQDVSRIGEVAQQVKQLL
jgi:alanyl-tRNA synthetase